MRLKWILLLIFQAVAEDEEAQNDINGEPFITCAADAIYVKFRTKSAFHGHVDLKFSPNKLCFQSLVTSNQIEVLIPHEECGLPRRRSLHPPGLIVDSTIAIAFNPEFTTINDKIFHVNCFHQKRHNSSLSNGTPTMPLVEDNSPSCSYNVVSTRNQRPVGRVSLGDDVQHHWTCTNIYNSCITVTNCALMAAEKRHQLVDSEGCSIHQNLMPHPVYRGPDEVAVNVSVFGVSSTGLVHFACDIALQPRLPTGICPTPECPSSGEQRRHRRHSTDKGPPAIDVRSQNIEISLLESTEQEDDCPLPTTEASTTTTMMTRTSTTRKPQEATSSTDDDVICINTVTVVILTVIVSLISAVLASSAMCLFKTKKYEVGEMI